MERGVPTITIHTVGIGTIRWKLLAGRPVTQLSNRSSVEKMRLTMRILTMTCRLNDDSRSYRKLKAWWGIVLFELELFRFVKGTFADLV